MIEWIQSPFFGIVLSVFAYEAGLYLQRKLKNPIANPLLIAIVLVITVLTCFRIPLEAYQQGGDIISLFLAPVTVLLAVSIYRQLEVLKKNLLPVVVGCLAGAVASILSVFLFSKLFGLSQLLTTSLIPKSVTTPIAMEISTSLGGSASITVAAVVITGIIGAVLAPTLIRLFGEKDSVSAGVAIGASAHALGTTKAIQIGETEGAMSGIAIGISGIITVIISLFL